jgi:VWFA-related protein
MLKERIAVWIAAGAILNAVLCLAGPQDKPKESAYDISVSAVSIAVTVLDKKGRFINDLTADDFTVFENRDKKEITYFKHDFQAPISLTILLDVSGSMELQQKMEECKAALRYLLNYLLRDQDEVSLLIFADGEVEVASPFSADKQGLLTVLAGTEAYGQTALNDAVAVSPEFANRGKNEKRALLLITDGVENDSYSTPEQAVEIARRVDVPIYTIGYKIPLSEQLEKHKRAPDLSSAGIVQTLDRFSRATGGKAYFITRIFDLNAAMREIKRELSHQYIIGYTSYTDPEGGYRKIEVKTSRKKYRVRTRAGY